jgi:hypothetical protein
LWLPARLHRPFMVAMDRQPNHDGERSSSSHCLERPGTVREGRRATNGGKKGVFREFRVTIRQQPIDFMFGLTIKMNLVPGPLPYAYHRILR